MIETARPILAAHGLAIVQTVNTDAGNVEVSTTLIHESGEAIEFPALTMPAGSTPQALGSLITYLRRYSLMAAVGVAADDDDGAIAAQPAPTHPANTGSGDLDRLSSQSQARKIGQLFGKLEIEKPDRRDLVAAIVEHSVTSMGKLTATEADRVIDCLDQLDHGTLTILYEPDGTIIFVPADEPGTASETSSDTDTGPGAP